MRFAENVAGKTDGAVEILVEIFHREVFNQSYLCSEEVSQTALPVIAFIGGPIAPTVRTAMPRLDAIGR
jgi:hypothetical protein